MHETQISQKWIERFKFQKKKLQKNSNPTLCFLLMFQAAKYPSDLSLLKRIEPEVVAPYIEKNEDGKQDSKKSPDTPKSGCSTPEIEPYSAPINMIKLEDCLAQFISTQDQNQIDQQNLKLTTTEKKKIAEFEVPRRVVVEALVNKTPSNTQASQMMDIEKEEIQQPAQKIEISQDTERLLTQPFVTGMDEEEEEKQHVIVRDPRLRKAMAEPIKKPESAKMTFSDWAKNELKKEEFQSVPISKQIDKMNPLQKAQLMEIENEKTQMLPSEEFKMSSKIQPEIQPQIKENSYFKSVSSTSKYF